LNMDKLSCIGRVGVGETGLFIFQEADTNYTRQLCIHNSR
jgi:hypothetical protein